MKQKLTYSLFTSLLILCACSSPTDLDEDKTDSGSINASTDEQSSSSVELNIYDENSSSGENSSSNNQGTSSVEGSSSESGSFTSEPNDQDCAYDVAAHTLACDEKTYKTVVIGDQVWMAENLNYGEVITYDKNSTQSGSQKYCYDDIATNCDTRGGLYQWHTAMAFNSECVDGSKLCGSSINDTHQGICPNGWHIPSKEDWDALGVAVNGIVNPTFPNNYDLAGLELKSIELGGENNFEFNASGAGSIFSLVGEYSSDENGVHYWESTEKSTSGAASRQLSLSHSSLKRFDFDNSKKDGISIRCLKD